MARKRTEPRGKRWRNIRASQEAGLKKMLANPDRYAYVRRRKNGKIPKKPALRGGREGKLLERLPIAGLLGTGLSVKSVAARTGVNKGAVAAVQRQMKDPTLRGEAFRKAAQEARAEVQGEALDALKLAIAKAAEQIRMGVTNAKGKRTMAPLSHVAQAVRSLADVALHEAGPGENPRQPETSPSTVPLTARQIGELLLQVRDHEQAKGRKEIDVTPKASGEEKK